MIRKAKVTDAIQIEFLMKSVEGFWDNSWRKTAIKIGIKSSNSLSFVYVEKGKVLGFVCAHDVGFRGYLSELIVTSKIQGSGVGKKLLQRVENKLRKSGCKILISDVWKNSEGFYSKMGWSKPNVKLLRKVL